MFGNGWATMTASPMSLAPIVLADAETAVVVVTGRPSDFAALVPPHPGSACCHGSRISPFPADGDSGVEPSIANCTKYRTSNSELNFRRCSCSPSSSNVCKDVKCISDTKSDSITASHTGVWCAPKSSQGMMRSGRSFRSAFAGIPWVDCDSSWTVSPW